MGTPATRGREREEPPGVGPESRLNHLRAWRGPGTGTLASEDGSARRAGLGPMAPLNHLRAWRHGNSGPEGGAGMGALATRGRECKANLARAQGLTRPSPRLGAARHGNSGLEGQRAWEPWPPEDGSVKNHQAWTQGHRSTISAPGGGSRHENSGYQRTGARATGRGPRAPARPSLHPEGHRNSESGDGHGNPSHQRTGARLLGTGPGHRSTISAPGWAPGTGTLK